MINFYFICLSLCCAGTFVLGVPSDLVDTLRNAPRTRVKRIIGGDDVELGDWPWLVHLKGKIPSRMGWWGVPLAYKNYYCGGSVIDKRWVLTAAHCFSKEGAPSRITTPKYWHAKVGEIEASHGIFDRLKSLAGGVIGRDSWKIWNVHASKIIIHPQYDQNRGWQNDIALIKLEEDLPVGDDDPNISKVKLPTDSSTAWPVDGEDCIMKGWGCTQSGGRITDTARAVKLPKVEDGVCLGVFGIVDLKTRVCAGYNLESKGICAGDSGGPLVCKKGNEWVQAGLASFTSANRPGEVPGVFTRVSYYIEWIQQTMDNN